MNRNLLLQRAAGSPSAAVSASSPRRSRLRLRLAAAMVLAGVCAYGTPAAAAPDLVVQNLSVDPDSGPNGTNVHITMDIRNQGSSNALASTTRIRINGDPSAVTSTDVILCNISTSSLAAGATVQIGCNSTISGRPSGPSYIWAIADVNKTAGQGTATTNDRSHTTFTVGGDSPDLVVQSLSLVPDTLDNGEELSIGVTIKNQGGGTAQSSTTRVRINTDPGAVTSTDQVLCNIATPSLAAGDSIEVGCTPTVGSRPAGANYVWAIADVNKTAGQSDTTNDRRSGSITIASGSGGSDLIVESITTDPEIGANGESITVTAVIRNQGAGDAPKTSTRFRINSDPAVLASGDPVLCSGVTTDAIPAGESTEVSCHAELDNRPAGTSYIWVVADATNIAGQLDRTNDRNNIPIEIDPTSTPDLVVKTLSVSPTTAASGDRITITARVGNQGPVGAPATKTRFLINQSSEGVEEGDTVLCEQVNTFALSPGASVLINCKPTLVDIPAGSSFIWAVADATGLSGEGDRENNAKKAFILIEPGPAPDLVVDSVVAAPASGTSGTAVTITATIRNAGESTAAESLARFRFSRNPGGAFETDPILCDNVVTPELAVGATAEVECTWTVASETPGAAYLWVTADVGATSGQEDLTNDSASGAFTILAPDAPDLVVTRLVVRPRMMRNGQDVAIRARVENLGSKKAKASMMSMRINQDPADVSVADDLVCDQRPIPALAPTETARVRCVARIEDRPIGENVVWAIADEEGSSGDPTTANNRKAKIVTVEPACTDPDASPVLEWPVEQARVMQDYATYGSVPLGAGKLGYHSGVDLRSHLPIAASQLPVYAAADGEVVLVKKSCPSPADPVLDPPNGSCAGGWGNFVVVRHGGGIFTVYAHLGAVTAELGCVTGGERIATVGSSGLASNPVMLHFDVLADLVDPVSRQQLGLEYYRKYHPFTGRTPETEDGAPQTHLDPRDYITRDRIRITADTTASREKPTGGETAYLAKDQQYVSYGELVPGYVMIDLPWPQTAEDGAPYSDDVRYGWVSASKTSIVETGAMPGTVRVDGLTLFQLDGVGANYVSLRALPSEQAAEITKAWGGQQLVPAGPQFTDTVSGKVWRPVYVPGTAATGAGKPTKAWVDAELLGPAPTP